MAKKIILAFNEGLQTGIAYEFNFEILINGTLLTYNYGTSSVTISYYDIGGGFVIPNVLEKKATLKDTVSATLNWLNTYFANPAITYSKIENTIEVYIDSESATIQNLYSSNIGVVTSYENINVIVEGEIKLKYFLEYKNIVYDNYRFEIYQVGYTGTSTEIHGRATINKASVKDHLDNIRGTGVSVTLEASETLTLEDLYSESEFNFPVKFYKNNKLIFRGFLNPDGVFQSFTRSEWQITLDCVDGLGSIDNLSFVKDNGLHYVGKMSAQDIIFNCLRRTGMLQKINTSVNIFYEGYEDLPNRNIFQSVELNTDRYVKEDNDTIMSCGEVLRSILTIFNASITQENGEWYIYRSNEIYFNGYVEFKKYSINNVFENSFTKNINKILGSQVDNFSPFHCGGNQKIQIKGSISAFRINYKYGFDTGVLNNGYLFHTDDLDYPFWNVNPAVLVPEPPFGSVLQNNPLDDYGAYSRSQSPGFPQLVLMTSAPIPVETGYKFTFKATYINESPGEEMTFFTRIRVGTYSLAPDGTWFNGVSYVSQTVYGDRYFTIDTDKLPVGGDLYIDIMNPYNNYTLFNAGLMATQKDFNLINTFDGNNIVGEFHTVQRGGGVSSIVKENKEVANGDNSGIAYVGALYKNDGLTLTDKWYRKNNIESKPLLRICAEDSLRISQKPCKIFYGSFYGDLPYLSLQKINNIDGCFMAVEYSFDTYLNTGTQKLLQLFSNDIPDIIYKYTYDYGETVKPTIIR